MIRLNLKKSWLIVFCVLLFCMAGSVIAESSAPATQTSDQSQPTTTAATATDTSLIYNVKRLPHIVIDDTKEFAGNWNNVWPLLLAGGASIAMHNGNADRDVADNFERHRALDKTTDEITTTIGGPGFHFAAAGLWYLISEDKGDDFNRKRAWTMIEALSITGATTLGLKLIRDNDTPNGKWHWPPN